MSSRDIARLLRLVEAQLGKSWVEIAEWLREQNSLDALEARLLAGDYAGVVAEVESAARRFAAETHAQFVRAGQAGATWLDEQPQLADKLIRFDITNDRAVRAAQRSELELVRGMTAEAHETVRVVLIDGQRAGLNPRTIARDIRDTVTLTPHQTQHVLNYRRALENGDFRNALGRELRDARSDRMLRRLARDGGSLTEKQIDSLVDRYRNNYVAFRAETIARTESARNVHAGLDEAMRQAVDRGDVEADQLVCEWIAGPATEDARPEHQEADGQQVKWGELFVFSDGVRKKYPGDGNGGAAHDANCRCTIATTLAA